MPTNYPQSNEEQRIEKLRNQERFGRKQGQTYDPNQPPRLEGGPPLAQIPPPPTQKPLIDLQVYEPFRPQKPRPPINPSLFTPIATNCPNYPPQFMGQIPQYLYTPKDLPYINNYVIKLGPDIDRTYMTSIFEDVLPTSIFESSLSTIADRLNLYNFIRSVFIKRTDGEDISLNQSGPNSIISYLRLLELNPYDTSNYMNNPYKSLPEDMLIYRSCYPIRHDSKNNTTVCAMNSVAINIRIYRLPTNAIKINHDNDIWREIIYYEYVKETIIKKKVCPNFVIMYLYLVNSKNDVDFNRANKLRNTPFNQSKGVTYSNTSLVVLTESPTTNMEGWYSRKYIREGNVKRMVNTGFHKDEVWYSVIFQIMAGLYTMSICGIKIEDFSIKDNVYIKDLNMPENVINYWKYKIEGIDYYIPNYGYLVLIDSNFKDLPQPSPTNPTQKKKVYLAKLDTLDNDENKVEIDKVKLLNEFKRIFDINKFNNGGSINLPDSITTLLNLIRNDTDVTNIYQYFEKYMTRYMNNRIGTYVRENEIKNIRPDERNYKKGDIIVKIEEHDTYKFVIYLESDNDNIKILTKLNITPDIIAETIPNTLLRGYSKLEPVIQDFKPSEYNLNEQDIIETYIINDI